MSSDRPDSTDCPLWALRDRERRSTERARHVAESPSPVSAIAGLMALQNDDGRGSVLGVRDRWRAERSPSAKSGLPKVGSMTTPSAEYGCVLPGCATRRYPVQLALHACCQLTDGRRSVLKRRSWGGPTVIEALADR